METPYLRSPAIASADWAAQAALGQLRSHDIEIKFGSNTAVSTTEEDIWLGGGLYSWLDKGVSEYIDIVSDHVNDTLLGTGTRQTRIQGLDVDGSPIEEIIDMNGTTPVRTTLQYWRVYRMYSEVAATRLGQAGVITARTANGAVLQAIFNPYENQTLQALYTVPKGYAAAILGINVSTGKGDEVKIRFYRKDNGTHYQQPQRVRRTITVYQANVLHMFPIPYVVDELTDVWISGQASVASLKVDAEIYMVLVDRGSVPRFT
jgi:hypothetical protein